MNSNILLHEPTAKFEPHLSLHRELPFIYHQDTVRQRAVFNIHENLEFLYMLEGSGAVRYSGSLYPVHTGDIVVINSYVPHQVITDDELKQFCLIIDQSFCKYNNIDPTKLQFQRIIHDRRAESLIRDVIDSCSQSGPFQYADIKCAVLNLLLFACHHYCQPREEQLFIKDSSLEHIRLAMDYAKRNFANKITADEIAVNAGLSKFHFLREFKRITGYTLTQYLNTIRCEHAVTLLKSGQHQVKEVALMCGFESNSYFSRVFQQYTAQLPSAFIPLHASENAPH